MYRPSATTLVSTLAGLLAPTVSSAGASYSSHLPSRDFSGWYQNCMDKIASQSCFSCSAEVSNDSGGCKCTYFSEIPGAWGGARQSLWDLVINEDHSCSDALLDYENKSDTGGPWGGGIQHVYLTFSCH